MPPACCCYCGSTIKEGRFRREATEEVLAHAAEWRSAAGKQPLLHGKHVCGTHNSHPPQWPAAAEVRKRMYNEHSAILHPPSPAAHQPVLLALYILFLYVYRDSEQQQLLLQQSPRVEH